MRSRLEDTTSLHQCFLKSAIDDSARRRTFNNNYVRMIDPLHFFHMEFACLFAQEQTIYEAHLLHSSSRTTVLLQHQLRPLVVPRWRKVSWACAGETRLVSRIIGTQALWPCALFFFCGWTTHHLFFIRRPCEATKPREKSRKFSISGRTKHCEAVRMSEICR